MEIHCLGPKVLAPDEMKEAFNILLDSLLEIRYQPIGRNQGASECMPRRKLT